MPSDLHGGGIRFTAEPTIAEIAEQGASLGAIPFAPPPDQDDGNARIVISRATPPGDFGGAFQLSISDAARALIGLVGEDDPRAGAAPTTAPSLYYRIVDTRRCFEPLDDCVLRKIARNMRNRPSGAPVLPAAYTYFGQFIAHDITWMQYTGKAGDEWNHRSHAFDLDSLFGELTKGATPGDGVECLATPPHSHICLGRTSGDRLLDLPRSADGKPCLADPRNDNNLAVAQLTVAIIRFIGRLQELHRFGTVAELQREAARYLQAILMHEYLPALCDGDVLRDIAYNGPRLVPPVGPKAPFHVPTEFAAAAFRFGHSMVNDGYPWGTEHPAAGLFDLLLNTYLGHSLNRKGRLPDEWVVDWARFAGPSAQAQPIDTGISQELHRLWPQWLDAKSGIHVDPSENDLSYITLFRSQQLRLANTQQLIARIADPKADCRNPPRIADTFAAGDPACDGLCPAELAMLNANTPIWLFVLREAERAATGRFGPVGSRLVAETLIASVAAAHGNILSEPPFKPHKHFGEFGPFTLFRLLASTEES